MPMQRKFQFMATDREGRDVFLADSAYVLTMAPNDFPKIRRPWHGRREPGSRVRGRSFQPCRSVRRRAYTCRRRACTTRPAGGSSLRSTYVFLADSAYVLTMAQNDFPKIRFHFSSEF